MPSFSNYSPGSYSQTIPIGALNVRYTIAAATGGSSHTPGIGGGSGGWGRTGNFSIQPRSYAYTLSFYTGAVGGNGVGPHNPGGSGGWSPIASGGNGHRAGGGGGGASAVYDGGLNRYIAWVGGGGGAGRHGDVTSYPPPHQSAGRGIGGGVTSGSTGWRNGQNASAGHRGGGGGGSTTGGSGGLGGAQTTNGYAGIGGNSGYWLGTGHQWYYPGYANYSNGYYTLSYEYAPPVIQYFTATPTELIQYSQNVNLSWSAAGDISLINIVNTATNLANTGSINVNPASTTVYTLSVGGNGGSTTANQSVTVWIPPEVTLSSDAVNNTIIIGQSCNLSWVTTGTADTANLSPVPGTVPINSSTTISPTDTTTYTIQASGLGGLDSDQITITVIGVPEVSLSVDPTVDYGDSINFTASSEHCTVTHQVLVKYYYLDGTSSDYEIIDNLPLTQYSVYQSSHTPTYNNIGPSIVEYKLYGEGLGGLTDDDIKQVIINIDETPDAIVVPESGDLFKDEDPVVTPEETVTTNELEITDIDIPVEIKSNHPIQVEIDDDDNWRDVGEI